MESVLTESVLTGVYWFKGGEKWIESNDWGLIVTPKCHAMLKPKSYPVYYTHATRKEWIGIPRFLGLQKFGAPGKDSRGGESIEVTLGSRTLRPHQQEAIEKTLPVLHKWGGATIIADCGSGKSGIGAAMICALQHKTLWITPRTVLMTQAKNDLEIWIPGVKVGWLQGPWNPTKKRRKTDGKHADTCPDDVDNKDVIVASIDSLAQCTYPPDFLKTFGLVIVDEMHVLAAQSLTAVLPLLPSKYVLGLTATPERPDGLEHVLYWLVGPQSFVYKRIPSITGLTGTVVVEKKECKFSLEEKYTYRGELDFTNTLVQLSKHPERNAYITTCIQELMVKRRKVLVVTAYIDHALDLQRSFPNSFFLYSKATPQHIAESKLPSARLLFATYGYLSVGYDDEDLDALILATPRSGVQQTVGRIERTKEGKLVPIVYDLVDSLGFCAGMWNKRRKFYSSRGFSIR